MTKPKWKVEVCFVGEAPTDGGRILRDVKKLLSYDRCHGRIGNYWYGQLGEVVEDVHEWMVQRTPTKKELKCNPKIKQFRNVHIRTTFLNRRWRTVITPGGNTVYLCEAA